MKKNKTLIIIILVLVIGALAFFVFKPKMGFISNSKVGKSASSTKIENNDKMNSYKLDLRINGNYKNKRYFEIVMVTNYQNKEKDITITKSTDKGEEEYEYLVKDSKYYQVKDEKLTEVKSVPYTDTDIYLLGAENLKDSKQIENQKIGTDKDAKVYSVYTGKVSKSIMNKVLAATDLEIKIDKDVDAEVWIGSDGHVYKVYYRFDGLTVYASYFGYNVIRGVDLDYYNNTNKS